ETGERLKREVARIEESFAAGRRRGLAGEAVERLFAEAPGFGAEPPAQPAGPRGRRPPGRPPRPARGGRPAETGGARGGGRGRGGDGGGGRGRGRGGGGRAGELVPGGAASEGREAVAAAAASGPGGAGSARPPRGGRDLDETAQAPAEINLIGVRVEPALE